MIKNIRKELKANIEPEYKVGLQRFFKERITVYGVRTPIVRKIAARHFKSIKDKPKSEIFDICEILLESGFGEEITIAFDWAYRFRKAYEPADFKLFESWLRKYITNWGSCDGFCCRAFGEFLFQYPRFLKNVKTWTKSDNRWFRRAAAVIMIYPNKRDKYIEDSFEIADRLFYDSDDMVQKGYGWMLKEISNLYPQKVFNYVMANKKDMPRTALRYAIEKLTPKMKKEAMKK